VVQVSGGALARTSSVAPSIKIKSKIYGEIGSTQFLEQGLSPCSFFFRTGLLFRDGFENHRGVVFKTKQMTPSTNPIQLSFELAAERCEDLTPLVYRRLFREHPEAEAMFRSDGSDPVKGSMLALTIDAILDFAGERTGHFRLIECEVSSHDAYGTPRDLFVAFFGVIADSLREILGTDWSPEMSDAWRKLLAEIDGVVAQSQAVD
jgi:hemoglobin-like flavoprotein